MNVLIISVHPDDETLGCGGTILKHRAAGDDIQWIVVTETYEPDWSREVIEAKAEEVRQVAKAYGIAEIHKLHFLSTRLDVERQSDLIAAIQKAVAVVRPQIVYLIHGGDIHTDHFAAFNAAMSVFKPFYMKKYGVQRVLCFETLSSTEAAPALPHRLFTPTVYCDITPYLERKIEIMGLYATELHADPFPRGPGAMRALARYRGATVSVEYAEAFMLIRELI
jgi:LmbE family N-acetylglucosaminyl deacetylase